MKILLYGINYSPELTGIGKYSGEMAQWLAARGHNVCVVTAPPYYPQWRVQAGFSSWRYSCHHEGEVRVFRCPLYVPRNPSAIKRVLHLASFSITSSLALFSRWRWKPDVMILVVPTLFCAPQALLFSKLVGTRIIIHIQDYEVDALFGLSMAKGTVLKRFAYACERFLLRRFGKVSAISPAMLKRAQQKGVSPDKLFFFPNWSENRRFKGIARNAGLLQRLGVPEGQKLVLYSGNIGEKQGLENLVAAADILRDRSDLFFLVVGDGADKSRLVSLAAQNRLGNMAFAPLQSYDLLPDLLASADCHLIIQKRGAADAVLPSKLTNILAVGGNAVITADVATTLGRLCTDFPGIATLVTPESGEALVRGIQAALLCVKPNRVALDYANRFLDKDEILSQFLSNISIASD